MARTPIRDRKTRETRARIAEAALGLFVTYGYAQTTIDQIAESASVGRRTIFHHFPTKEAILLDHLIGRRELTLQHLRDRPRSEPPLLSLYTVFRELCEQGYDRRVLGQIRAVLDTEPRLVAAQLSLGIGAFEKTVVATIEDRADQDCSPIEIRAVTFMAIGWFISAVHVYLVEDRPSLVQCFDEAVGSCLRWNVDDLAGTEGAAARAVVDTNTGRRPS